jgi:tetratricopeptide (TPR) repeat protein
MKLQNTCLILTLTLGVLTSCETVPEHVQERPPSPEEIAAEKSEEALRQGIALYEKGDFEQAIQRLSGAYWIWDAASPVAVKVKAHKYIAFSYCVTNREEQCQAQFEHAIRLDRHFILAEAERGHPMWWKTYLIAYYSVEGKKRANPDLGGAP